MACEVLLQRGRPNWALCRMQLPDFFPFRKLMMRLSNRIPKAKKSCKEPADGTRRAHKFHLLVADLHFTRLTFIISAALLIS